MSERTVTVGLGTQSEIKMKAVKGAFEKVFAAPIKVSLLTCAADSGINAQPVGFPETILGATNRLKETKHQLQTSNCEYFVAIENGIVSTGEGQSWIDLAWVIVEDANKHRQFTATSVGIPFPTRFVESAKEKGFYTTTAGDVMAKELKCNTKDPHAHLTSNFVNREALLQQAIVAALGQSVLNLSQ